MNSKLKILCELYNRSDENVNADALLKVCFFKSLLEVLELLSHKQCIKFVYLCAKSISYLCNEKEKEKVEKILSFVEEEATECYCIRGLGFDDLYMDCYCSIVFSVAYSAYAATTNKNFCYAYANNTYKKSIKAVKNKQEQEYKNLGFLVKVIRDG